MEISELKQKTISSMMWNAIQRFGTMILSFCTNIILARLLMPEDFGCIGMLTIFLAISEVFIDGGFATALIQKKNTTQEDYSTIFYWNIIVSSFFFLLLQLCAPYIADFYHMPQLCPIMRVLSVVLIINGFTVVQTNILTKKLSFQLIAKIRLFAAFIAMSVAILAAYLGMGVWSLVLNSILSALIGSILFWFYNKWRPTLGFSRKSFKELFPFGGIMLLSNIANSLFEHLQGLVIGRLYTSRDLGLYSQSKRLDQIVTSSLSSVVTQVSFPVLAQVADDNKRLVNAIRKNIVATTYIIFPLQVLLITVAEPLILTLFTDKWAEAIPYYQIMCIYGMFISLNAINSNVYKALGKGKVYFFVQLTKRFFGIALLLICSKYGVIGITWSIAISGIVWWIFTASINTRILNYGIFKQIRDIYRHSLIAIGLGLIVFYMLRFLNFQPLITLLIVVPFYCISFLGLSSLLKLEGFQLLKTEVLDKYIHGLKKVKN